MKILVEYHAQARAAVGSGRESIELGDGATVRQLLDRLTALHGDAMRAMLSTSLIFVGDEQVKKDGRVDLSDGDVVSVISPISGG